MPPTTTTFFVGVPRSDMLEAYVRVRAYALGDEFPSVLTCRFAVEALDRGRPRHVRLAVSTAEDAVFAAATVGSGVPSCDVYMLVDRAVERSRVQLGKLPRRIPKDLAETQPPASTRPSIRRTTSASVELGGVGWTFQRRLAASGGGSD